MQTKHSMGDLIRFEQKHQVWEQTFYDYPLWIHFREDLISGGIKADRQMHIPTVAIMFKSMFQTFKFLLFTQKKSPRTYFLMERPELLEVYKRDLSDNKVLFLNFEQEHIFDGDYISADFFNLLRYLSRKTIFLLFPSAYNSALTYFQGDYLDSSSIKRNIKNGMGDAFFLLLLEKLLRPNYAKFYSGSVIPIGEKFINRLNTTEVQHGIIHSSHVGYMALPAVKNTLMLYDKRYEQLLLKNGYSGKLVVNPYKKEFLQKESSRHFRIVIYTQPFLEMQDALTQFLLTQKEHTDIYIQKHPKDYRDYPIDHKHIVNATTPKEVDFPIFYTSSVIENFTLMNRTCFIWDLSDKIDIYSVLEIFLVDSSSKIYIEQTLDDIINIITSTAKAKTSCS